MQEAAKFDDVDLVWNVTAVASESVGAASGTHVNYIGLDEAFLIRMNWDQVFGSALLKLSEEFSLEPYKLGSNLFKLHGNLFAGEVLQQWLDIDELQRERNKLRVLSNYLKEFSDSEFSSNVFSSDVNDCALHFVTGSVPEQELTQHFLELDEDVFRQDNWATCPQITNCDVSAVPICGPLTWTTLPQR